MAAGSKHDDDKHNHKDDHKVAAPPAIVEGHVAVDASNEHRNNPNFETTQEQQLRLSREVEAAGGWEKWSKRHNEEVAAAAAKADAEAGRHTETKPAVVPGVAKPPAPDEEPVRGRR